MSCSGRLHSAARCTTGQPKEAEQQRERRQDKRPCGPSSGLQEVREVPVTLPAAFRLSHGRRWGRPCPRGRRGRPEGRRRREGTCLGASCRVPSASSSVGGEGGAGGEGGWVGPMHSGLSNLPNGWGRQKSRQAGGSSPILSPPLPPPPALPAGASSWAGCRASRPWPPGGTSSCLAASPASLASCPAAGGEGRDPAISMPGCKQAPCLPRVPDKGSSQVPHGDPPEPLPAPSRPPPCCAPPTQPALQQHPPAWAPCPAGRGP